MQSEGLPDHPLIEDQTKDVPTDVKLSVRRLKMTPNNRNTVRALGGTASENPEETTKQPGAEQNTTLKAFNEKGVKILK